MAKADSRLELRSASVDLITEAPPHLECHFRKLHGSSQKILQVLRLCYRRGLWGPDLYVSGTILAFHWCSSQAYSSVLIAKLWLWRASGGQH